MACSPKKCVGVDGNNSLITTGDGKNWSATPTNVGELNSVTWTGQEFRVVGFGAIGSSTDGSDWTFKSWGVSERSWQILAGGQVGGRFFALGSDSMLVSSDGVNWRSDTTACHVSGDASFASNGNIALIVRQFAFCRSVDSGRTWSFQSFLLTNQGIGVDVRTVIWDGNKFVIGTGDGAVSSVDGLEWVSERSQGIPLEYLAGDTGSMVAVGLYGVEMRHSNGTWTRIDSSDSWGAIHALQKSPWGYLAVGDVGVVASSADGRSWARSPVPNTYRGVAFATDRFVAVGDSGLLSTSPDGIVWKMISTPSKVNLRSVAGGGGKSIVVGDSGRILVATDSANWLASDSKTLLGLRSAVWEGHEFIAGGEQGVILVSNDAATWTTSQLPSKAAVVNLQASGGQVFALDDAGDIWKRSGGSGWDKSSPASAKILTFSGSPDSGLIAYDANNRLWKSASGTDWSVVPFESFTSTTPVVSILRTTGQWIAMEEFGNSQSSTDGVKWKGRGASTGIRSLAAHDGVIVGVGANGLIVTSPEVVVAAGIKKHISFAGGIDARIRLNRVIVVPSASEDVDLQISDLSGRVVFSRRCSFVANQEFAIPLPFIARSSIVMVLRGAGGIRKTLLGPAMALR